MTQIDFHILQQGGATEALLYCCRLVEKAWQRGHQIFIHCRDEAQCEVLDELLWSFRADSFLPHARQGGAEEAIALGTAEQLGHHCDVLINLGGDIPEAFSRFRRLAEIVCQEEQWLNTSRQRFRFYQHRGYPLQRHDISGKGHP